MGDIPLSFIRVRNERRLLRLRGTVRAAFVLLGLLALVLATAPLAAAQTPTNLSHRYVVFVDGINSSSAVSDLFTDFGTIQQRLQNFGFETGHFAYFSYGAANKYPNRGQYCSAWANGCTSSGDLVVLFSSPTYAPNDTHLSIEWQIDVLDWLLGQIIQRDPLAQIDIVGFSLGGIVSTGWGQAHLATSALGSHIHGVILLESPVGGIFAAGTAYQNDSSPAALAMDAQFGPIVGPQVAVEGSNSIIRSLERTADSYPVTSIQSTLDYLVNGRTFPLCAITCLNVAVNVIPSLIGQGVQTWLSRSSLTYRSAELGTDFGARDISNGISYFDAFVTTDLAQIGTTPGQVFLNHGAPLKDPLTSDWIIQALQANPLIGAPTQGPPVSLASAIVVSPNPGATGSAVDIGFSVRNDGDADVALSEVFVEGTGPDGYWKAWACGGPNGQPACSALVPQAIEQETSVLPTAGSGGTWSMAQVVVYASDGSFRVIGTDVGAFAVTGPTLGTVEQEPNDTRAQATPLALGVPMYGFLFKSGPGPTFGGDTDLFRVNIAQPGKLVVHVDPPAGGGNWSQAGSLAVGLSTDDPVVGVGFAGTGQLAPSQSVEFTVGFDPTQLGDYFISIQAPYGPGGVSVQGAWSDQPYTLTTTFMPSPSLRLLPGVGGTLVLPNSRGRITFPPNTATTSSGEIDVFYVEIPSPSHSLGGFSSAGFAFTLAATDSHGNAVTQFPSTYAVSLNTNSGIIETPRVRLTYFDSQNGKYVIVPTQSFNSAAHELTASLDHMTEFAALIAPAPLAFLSSATVDTSTLLITLTSAVQCTAGPCALGFVVRDPASGQVFSLSNASRPTPTQLMFDLTTPVSFGEQVELSYDAASGGLTDRMGTPLDSISNQAVGNLTAPPLFVVTVSGAPAAPVDVGTSINLVASVAGGLGPFTYAWTKDGAAFSTLSSINDTPAVGSVVYRVVVTDSRGVAAAAPEVTIGVLSDGGGGSGGGCVLNCLPPPNDTPELDSVVLFGSGLSGLAGFALVRRRARRNGQQSRTQR